MVEMDLYQKEYVMSKEIRAYKNPKEYELITFEWLIKSGYGFEKKPHLELNDFVVNIMVDKDIFSSDENIAKVAQFMSRNNKLPVVVMEGNTVLGVFINGNSFNCESRKIIEDLPKCNG